MPRFIPQRLASLGLLLLLSSLFSGCAALNVSSRLNEAEILTQHKTFACIVNTTLEHYTGINRLTEAVFVDKLQALGMKYDSAAPDITIFIQFKASKKYIATADVLNFDGENESINIGRDMQLYYRGMSGEIIINIFKNTAPKTMWENVSEVPVYSRLSKEIKHSVDNIVQKYALASK